MNQQVMSNECLQMTPVCLFFEQIVGKGCLPAVMGFGGEVGLGRESQFAVLGIFAENDRTLIG